MLNTHINLVGRAGFEPAKLYKSHARLNLIESYYSESRVPSSKSNTVKHGVTVRVFDLFTTYPYKSSFCHRLPTAALSTCRSRANSVSLSDLVRWAGLEPATLWLMVPKVRFELTLQQRIREVACMTNYTILTSHMLFHLSYQRIDAWLFKQKIYFKSNTLPSRLLIFI